MKQGYSLRWLLIVLAIVAAVAITPAVKADPVVYTVSVTNFGSLGSWSWSFSTPTLITGPTDVGGSIPFLTNISPPGCVTDSASIGNETLSTFLVTTQWSSRCGFVNITHLDLTVLNGPITTPGVFPLTFFGTAYGTLTVSGGQVAAPEPSSLILLGSGLLALAGRKRNR